VAQRVGRDIALLFDDRGTRRGEWSAARPGRTLPPGKTRYPFYRRLGGPQGRSGRAENLVPTGIRSGTVQPVVSRYTDWAIRPIPDTGAQTISVCTQLFFAQRKIVHTYGKRLRSRFLSVGYWNTSNCVSCFRLLTLISRFISGQKANALAVH
jgi:hypothetical protein